MLEELSATNTRTRNIRNPWKVSKKKLVKLKETCLKNYQKLSKITRNCQIVWYFQIVLRFCVSGIVVNADEEQTRSFLLPVEGPPS